MLLDSMQFKSREEEIKYVKDNKSRIIAAKKAIDKKGDGVNFAGSGQFVFFTNKEAVVKANNPIQDAPDELNVTAIINTTNIIDSHLDMHVEGIWNKTLSENKNIMHLQEHKMAFDKIIADSDDLKAYTKKYSWSELGYNFEGETQALVFDSKVMKSRNAFMHEQYAKGYVKQHSVGMRYVKIVLCVDSEDEYYGAEKEAWDKYYPLAANKEIANEKGYFWVVKEAKLTEGSAVPLGSNYATPTLDNNKNKSEPDKTTQQESEKSASVDYKNILQALTQ